jgi:hypothetical protein
MKKHVLMLTFQKSMVTRHEPQRPKNKGALDLDESLCGLGSTHGPLPIDQCDGDTFEADSFGIGCHPFYIFL